MLRAWARRAERGTRQESRLRVCGEEGGLKAKRGGSGGACECSKRGHGRRSGGQHKNQGLGCAERKVVSEREGKFGGACGSLERWQGGPRGGEDKDQGSDITVWKDGGEGVRSLAEAGRMVCVECVCRHLDRECGPGGLLERAVGFPFGILHSIFWRIFKIHSYLRALVL